MKNLIFIGILLIFTTSAFAELTDSDLQRIREIVKVEIVSSEQRLRAEMTDAIQASEDRMKVYVDAKMSAVNSQLAQVNNRIDEVGKRLNIAFAVLGWLFALVIAALGIPQLITAFRQRGQERLQTAVEELYTVHNQVLAELKQLRSENEAIKQHLSAQSEHRSS